MKISAKRTNRGIDVMAGCQQCNLTITEAKHLAAAIKAALRQPIEDYWDKPIPGTLSWINPKNPAYNIHGIDPSGVAIKEGHYHMRRADGKEVRRVTGQACSSFDIESGGHWRHNR